MDDLEVEWDQIKARQLARRGVSFNEAVTVFRDPLAITTFDREHSTTEARYATIGMTEWGRLWVVVHTDRGSRLRLITAWPATPAERRAYERNQAE